MSIPRKTFREPSQRVIDRARLIVNQPATSLGYGDVGDVLVGHLRGEVGEEDALGKLLCLEEDYARKRRRDARPELPVMVFMGANASPSRVCSALDIGPRMNGWSRHIKVVQNDRDLMAIRGLRGLWWIDWGATQEMRNHAAVYEFKKVTVEECDAAIRAYVGEAS